MANLTEIPQKPDDMQKAIDTLTRLLPQQIILYGLLAKADFAKYEGYVKAGFSKSEALDLLKAEKIKATVA